MSASTDCLPTPGLKARTSSLAVTAYQLSFSYGAGMSDMLGSNHRAAKIARRCVETPTESTEDGMERIGMKRNGNIIIRVLKTVSCHLRWYIFEPEGMAGVWRVASSENLTYQLAFVRL